MIVPMSSDSNQAAASLPSPVSAQLKGMACLIVGIAIFSVQDLVIKLLSGDYPVHQAMTIRSLTATPLLLLVVLYEGGWNSILAKRPGALVLRGIVMFCAYTAYYLGLAAMPIATCIALFFTAPLFITILSIPMLGERVGLRRWTAVVFGFTGMLVMLRPSSDVFDWVSLLPVAAAFCYGLSQIMARRLGTFDRAGVMAFYGNGVFLLGGLFLSGVLGSGAFADEENRSLAFLLRGWVTPSLTDFLLMMACGVVAAAALVLLTHAYTIAEANTIAPFEYTALVWGVLYGWLFWNELPDAWTWIGIVIIMAAGLVILQRQGRSTG